MAQQRKNLVWQRQLLVRDVASDTTPLSERARDRHGVQRAAGRSIIDTVEACRVKADQAVRSGRV